MIRNRFPIQSERGAALLIVLLITASLSVAALAVMQTVSSSFRTAANAQARAQAIWSASGAEELGIGLINQAIKISDGRLNRNTPGLGQLLQFPITGGQVSAQIDDATNCFNLNALSQSQDAKSEAGVIDAHLFYQRLLFAIGIDSSLIPELVDSAADWVDADTSPRPSGAESLYYINLDRPYRSADGYMVSKTELRAIKGYTSETYRIVAPYVCARPSRDIGVFNVNTLSVTDAPLLVPVFQNEVTLEQMIVVIESQLLEPPVDVAGFLAHPNLSVIAPQQRLETLLSDRSSHFHLSGEVVYLDVRLPYEAVFALRDGRTQLVRRRFGEDE